MNFIKILPKESLLHSVEAYYFFVRGENETAITDYFFPNGKPAVVFHLQKPFSFVNQQDEWEKMSPVNIINCATCPVLLHSDGKTDTIAVVVTPSSIYNMYSLRLGNSYSPMDAQHYIDNELNVQLLEINNADARAKLLDNYFENKLKNYNPHDDLFKSICDFIIQNQGVIKRHSIADEFEVSESFIHKLFLQRIGISFKPYVQVVRISNILQELCSDCHIDWFEISEKYGFFDQAHFIKNFKKITGKTPQQYYRFDKTISAIFSAMD